MDEIILTDEEKQRDITLERINQYHYDAGEDFLDQNETLGAAHLMFGWLMGKYKQYSHEILDLYNKERKVRPLLTTAIFSNLDELPMYEYDDEDTYEDMVDKFYTDYAEFVNLTQHLKERVNYVLIENYNYYNKQKS